jgi:ADP-ribose pyrophosphatase YjhB (NUDIX family)
MNRNEMIRPRVAVVLVEDGKILLLKHKKIDREYWVLPGGGVEFGETIEEAGIRELVEETGLEVRLLNLLFISESIPPDKHRHVMNFYFQGKIVGGEEKLGEEEILAELQWHELDDLQHLQIYPQVTNEMLDALRGGKTLGTSIGNRWE